MMQSFLSSTTKNVTNNVVGTFVAQVLDLAYDVEDSIEFVVHLDTMSESDLWCRMIPACMRPPLPLDEAVGIIAQMKVRVQDVIQRKERYTLISDSGGPNPVMKMKQLHNVSSSFDMLAEAGSSAMNQRDMDALTKLVTKRGSHRQVVSVWALGGDHGAACKSIIRKAYDNPKIWQDFSCRAWVKLGSPFNLPEFCRSLTDQFRGAGPVKDDHIADEFEEQVNNRQYLLVLEDLSTKEDWGVIIEKLPDKSNSSCIVVLTEQFQVASFCTGLRYIQHFWADYSVCTFYEEVPANNALIGRTSDINQLPGYLAKARINELHVMSVWGIPGSGKSALVRNLYHEMAHLFEEHGWVNISHPFNLKDFSRSLLFQFNSHSNEAIGPVEQCRNLLKDHRCLVVIDDLDLQLTQEWGKIRAALLSRPTESVIIVITNEEKFAFHCADRKDLVFNVKALSVEAAIDLFKMKVPSPFFSVDNMENEVVLQQLIRKCGGLPKVIVALAEILSPVYNWGEKASMLNDNFVLNLETMPESDCLHGLFSWMQSYFDALPMHFRKLVAYLLIFPGHSSTRRRRLVMRWGAEGYSTDSESYTADENGEEHFSGLVNQAMIQPPPLTTITNMRMVSFKVNAIFREYMISRPLKENIATAIELFVLKGTCSPTSRLRGRHLVIEQSWTRDRIVFGKIDFSRLRSLTVFGQWESFFISEGMKVLRVLDLEDASGVTNKDLQNILKLLPRLKFLSLRGCSEISYLPSSVGQLGQLQMLDIRYTSIVTTPASITKLKKLQYIRAGPVFSPEDPSAHRSVALKFSDLRRCHQLVGVKVMTGIGKLTALHTLGVINVGSAGGKGILKELKNLTQLHKLGVSGVSRKNGKVFCSAVSCHSRLESLAVWLRNDSQNCLDYMVVPVFANELQSLKLYGHVEKLPRWIKELYNLKKLNLELDTLSNNDMKVLGDLQQLCVLRFRVKPPHDGNINFNVVVEGEEDHSYKNIKILEIASASNLHLTFGSRTMKNLELLTAGCCNNGSQLQFDGLNHLSKL
ncbi:disease resistance protein Pik-2-like [Miscanthus floridulus]|uniref:disease resistance protein Pik-2-like n=1 Tax=Miscanthus floridulus TaxID=154761 RepID=UPI00345B46E8